MITLDLPLPPPLSSLTTNGRGNGRPNSKRYKTWRRAAGNEILMKRRTMGAQHIPGRVSLTIVLSFYDLINKDGSMSKVRQDMSNRIKAIEDILLPDQFNFIEDDSLIDNLQVYRSWDIERGRVRLFVHPCNLFEQREAAE